MSQPRLSEPPSLLVRYLEYLDQREQMARTTAWVQQQMAQPAIPRIRVPEWGRTISQVAAGTQAAVEQAPTGETATVVFGHGEERTWVHHLINKSPVCTETRGRECQYQLGIEPPVCSFCHNSMPLPGQPVLAVGDRSEDQEECRDCDGTGIFEDDFGDEYGCHACDGCGYVPMETEPDAQTFGDSILREALARHNEPGTMW